METMTWRRCWNPARCCWARNDGVGDNRGFSLQGQISDEGEVFSRFWLHDVTGNGLPDLFALSENRQLVWYPNEGGSFQPARLAVPLRFVRTMRFGDADGNGTVDIFVQTDDALRWYANDGSGSFRHPRKVAGREQWLEEEGAESCLPLIDNESILEDIDGDGDIDIPGFRVVGRNDGAGHFEEVRFEERSGSLLAHRTITCIL